MATNPRGGFSSRQGAWGRIEATFHHVDEERSMWEHLYNTRVSVDGSGVTQLTARAEEHTATARRAEIAGVLPMVCAVCGEAFGMVNAVAYINDKNAGVRYYCKAHRIGR